MNEPIPDRAWTAKVIRGLVASDPDYASFAQVYAELSQLRPHQEAEAELLRDMFAILNQFPDRKLQLARLGPTAAPETFDGGIATIPLLLASAFLLRTHLRFRKNSDGQWDLTVEYKPADSALVKQLLANIARLISRS